MHASLRFRQFRSAHPSPQPSPRCAGRGGDAVLPRAIALAAECSALAKRSGACYVGSMKLYITPGSPYARIARIVVLEKGLADEVDIVVAQTRSADSPYYAINPSGRVPYLLRDDGVGLEESAVIAAWLDQHHGAPMFELPSGAARWEMLRLEALARGMVDGLSVWVREIRRPLDEQSPTVIRHESDRSRRLVDVWEREVGHALMRGPPNLAQITLGCALGLEARIADFRWRAGCPRLVDWFAPIAARPSFAATAPPADR